MIKKVHIKVIFLSLLCIGFASIVKAQELSRSERKAAAKEAIKTLKDGTLVLRLKSKNNKITAIEKLLSSKDLNEATRNRLRKNLKSTIEQRNKYNVSLTQAFENHYSFSNIYYMYDTASVSLKRGVTSGIFLDNSLELDPAIKIPDGDFFVIKTGTTDSSSTTGVEALVIMDKNLKDLERPFPYYVRINSIGRLFTRIFNHRNLVKKDSKQVVMKLERNLRSYNGELE